MVPEAVNSIETTWYLRQAKECLVNLHKASYFTDEEWITLDGILHKGKYVFTNGPPRSLLDDGSPLLMYNQSEENLKNEEEINAIAPLDEGSGKEEDSPIDTVPSPEIESSGTEWEPKNDIEEYSVPQEDDTITFDHINTSVQDDNFMLEHFEAAMETSHSFNIEDLDYFEEPTERSVTPKEQKPAAPSPRAAPSGLSQSVYHLPQLDIAYPPESPRRTSFDKEKPKADNRWEEESSPQNSDPYLGYVFRAAYDLEAQSKIRLKASAGDKIQVTKLVSSEMYFGFNLTSARKGQMTKQYIDDGIPFKITLEERREAAVQPTSKPIFDDFEETSADEWKEISPATKSSASIFSKASRSSGSRSSYVPEEYGPSSRNRSIASPLNSISNVRADEEPEKIVVTRDQLDIMMEAKFAELMKTQALKNSSFSVEARSQTERWAMGSSTTQDAPPRRKICGAWADPARTCKYSADTCPDLHEFPSAWGQNPNERASPASVELHPASPDGTYVDRASKIQETCQWWAIPSKGCRYTDDECKFLHEKVEPLPLDERANITCWYWATPGENCSLTADNCKFAHRFTGKVAPMPPGRKSRALAESRQRYDDMNREAIHGPAHSQNQAKAHIVESVNWREQRSTRDAPRVVHKGPVIQVEEIEQETQEEEPVYKVW